MVQCSIQNGFKQIFLQILWTSYDLWFIHQVWEGKGVK